MAEHRGLASTKLRVTLITLTLCCLIGLTGCKLEEQKDAAVGKTPSLAEVTYDISTIHPQFKNRERSFNSPL